MELEKSSTWNTSNAKSKQLPADRNSGLANGHKPIVNPLYDDDEFDVDTETPFLAALSHTDLLKPDKRNDGALGDGGNNIPAVEDGEILENSTDDAVFKERKTHRSASRSSRNDSKSKRRSKSRSRKSKNYSPERRSSSGRVRGERDRSSSYADRDKKRQKTTDAVKMRESMNCDKRESKRFVSTCFVALPLPVNSF